MPRFRRLFPWLCAAGVLLAPTEAPAADPPRADLVIADFDGESYGAWTVEGSAVETGPARGALLGQIAVDGFLGKGLVDLFLGGDDSTGTLTSPPFKIERPFLSFLIGGGNHREKLALELLVAGKTATLRVIDAATGGWGHVNVDTIVQTDTRPKGMLKDARREFVAETRFLQIPIKNSAANKKWVLIGASSDYQLGSFDTKASTPESPKLPGHRGRGFYAAQSFSDIPASGGLSYVPMPVNLRADDLASSVRAIGRSARFHSLEIHELGSAWPKGAKGPDR